MCSLTHSRPDTRQAPNIPDYRAVSPFLVQAVVEPTPVGNT